jgi:hypothetical protein
MTGSLCAQTGGADEAGPDRARRGRAARWATLLVVWTGWAPAGVAGEVGLPATTSRGANAFTVVRDIRELTNRRVIKSFDFDERKLGNVEDVPMYWQRHLADGFPHYLQGRFDSQVYHDAQPSFYLELNGGSLGYIYRGDDIPVHAASDYLVSLWVRPDRLVHARAYATVFYCNRYGQKLPQTERISEMIGGDPSDKAWHQLAIHMPGGSDQTRQIGIGIWVTQPAVWSVSGSRDDDICRQDIHAGAWFDDIHVVRLPRVLLTTSQDGNVFTEKQDVVLCAEVGDPDGAALSARLEVFSADGTKILTRAVRAATRDNPTADVIGLGRLPHGFYRAILSVWTGELQLAERQTTFLRIGPRLNDTEAENGGFGLVLDTPDISSANAAGRLIKLLHIPQVKLPIEVPPFSKRQANGINAEMVAFLEWLYREGIRATVVLDTSTDPPAPEERVPRASWGAVLEGLSRQPEVWRPWLANSLARYGEFVRGWQVGLDGDQRLAWDGRRRSLLGTFGKEMTRLAPHSMFFTPWPIIYELPASLPNARNLCLFVPNRVRPTDFSSYFRDFQKTNARGLLTVVEPLDPDRYERTARLNDLARRLIWSRAAGADVAYFPRPWGLSNAGGRDQLEPREEFIIFRTVAELLGNARPAGDLQLGEHVGCLLFDRHGEGTAILWDDLAPEEGRICRANFGVGAEQVDLWGERRAIPTVEGCQEVRVAPTLTFVRGTKAWLLRLQVSFALSPPSIESSCRPHDREVRFLNPQDKPIRGTLRLQPPPGWEVRPDRIPFSLVPRQELRSRVTLQFPQNEVAGRKTLTGLFTIDSDGTHEVTAQAPFNLGLDDLDVHCSARVTRGKLVVCQTVTNRGLERLEVEGYVLAPGKPRLLHIYRSLPPGQTTYRVFTLEDADGLVGRTIRVGLRDLRGPRVLNEAVLVQ